MHVLMIGVIAFLASFLIAPITRPAYRALYRLLGLPIYDDAGRLVKPAERC